MNITARRTTRPCTCLLSVFVLGMLFSTDVVEAVFTPDDGPYDTGPLKTAVTSCLAETGDGSCPIFIASNDASGNPHGAMSDWDVSKVTTMENLFSSYLFRTFNQDLSKWSMANVVTTKSMFFGAHVFNCDLSKWTMSRVTNMYGMFRSARAFNGDVTTWNVSSVTNLEFTFSSASVFNRDVGQWSVSRVTSLKYTFQDAKQFQQNLNNWDTSKVTSMESTFSSTEAFNQPLNW